VGVGVGVGVGNAVTVIGGAVTVTGGAVTVTGGAITVTGGAVTVMGVSIAAGVVQLTKSMAAKITDMTKIRFIITPVTSLHKKAWYSSFTLDLMCVIVNAPQLEMKSNP
jgi:hypothetical protein